MSDDPFQMPEWQALARECKLVRQLLGSGVTALGKADYADGKGNYYLGFFGISIGLERLAKLILVADYSIKNKGNLPAEKLIRKFGHQIKDLLDAVSKVEAGNNLLTIFKRPADPISTSIIECMESFANGKEGRYANFGDLNLKKEFEPIKKWWEDVATQILKVHPQGAKKAKREEANGRIISKLLDPVSVVLYFAEDGSIINDIPSGLVRTGETELVQKYGRLYTLQIIRWMSDVFDKLTHYGRYEKDIGCLFGHSEHFDTYRADDSYLKTRKVWPV